MGSYYSYYFVPAVIPNVSNVSRAVLIGINYTGTGMELEGCINDVKNIYAILTIHLQYKSSDIVVMTDDSSTFPSNHPTRDNILRVFREQTILSKPGDTLYIHYSGHGVEYPDRSREIGMEDCLLPLSGGVIGDNELNEILVQSISKGVNVIATMDACHSGSILYLPVRYTLNDLYDVDNKTELGQEDGKDIICIGGCRSTEGAGDTYENRQAQGVFTWGWTTVLTEILTSSGVPELYQIKWRDILLKVRAKLTEHEYTQIPELTSSSVKYLTSPFDL